MTDRTARSLDPRTVDAVPEADFVEQTLPAYPDEPTYADEGAETEPPAGEVSWSASEADVIEQSISVPLDDDYEDDSRY